MLVSSTTAVQIALSHYSLVLACRSSRPHVVMVLPVMLIACPDCLYWWAIVHDNGDSQGCSHVRTLESTALVGSLERGDK
jgi:hypothetical protein